MHARVYWRSAFWGLPAISGKVTKTTTVVAPSLSLKLIPPTSSRVARCLSDGLFMTYLAENERPKNWTTLKESLETAFAPRSEKRHYVGHLLNARQEGTLEEFSRRHHRSLIWTVILAISLRRYCIIDTGTGNDSTWSNGRAISDLLGNQKRT